MVDLEKPQITSVSSQDRIDRMRLTPNQFSRRFLSATKHKMPSIGLRRRSGDFAFFVVAVIGLIWTSRSTYLRIRQEEQLTPLENQNETAPKPS